MQILAVVVKSDGKLYAPGPGNLVSVAFGLVGNEGND
jgi:hypothetical protein